MKSDFLPEDFIDLTRGIRGKKLFRESLKKWTTFKVGGPADLLVFPEDLKDLKEIFRIGTKENIPIFVLGRGSNILVRDKGIRGIVVSLKYGFKGVEIVYGKNPKELLVKVGCGISLADLINTLSEKDIGGLEFLAGIPGSLGGALIMNAGTDRGEIGDMVRAVNGLAGEGELRRWEGQELSFGYRSSGFPQESVLLEAELELERREKGKITETIKSIVSGRREKLPVGEFCAGSVFKNPPGNKAGRLIEEAGFKGVRVGEAVVSSRHANIIVNEGKATAAQILALIAGIKEKVYDRTGIKLEEEIEVVGEE